MTEGNLQPEPAPKDESPTGARWFLGLFAVFLVLHVGAKGAAGTLELTPFGLLFGPMLLAGVGAMVALLARDVRAGNWGATAGVLVFLGALGAFLYSGWFARSMIFPGNDRRLPAPGVIVGQRGEVIDYTTSDGIALRGLLVRAPESDGPNRPVLVYFHGNGESVSWNVDIAHLLADAGIDVFMGEYRGYGGCPGSPHEEGLFTDGRAALQAACAATGAQVSQLVLLGRSLGSGVASHLAGEGHGRALVLISPYVSILSLAQRTVPDVVASFAVRDRFDSAAALTKSNQPVLVIHGTADRVIPYPQGEQLAKGLGPERARLVTLEDVGHNDIFGGPGRAVVAEITSFVGVAR